MPARSALEHQRVLTKLIAQLVDVKFGRHAADCYETAAARPSSTGILKTLYEPESANHTVVAWADPLDRIQVDMSYVNWTDRAARKKDWPYGLGGSTLMT